MYNQKEIDALLSIVLAVMSTAPEQRAVEWDAIPDDRRDAFQKGKDCMRYEIAVMLRKAVENTREK